MNEVTMKTKKVDRLTAGKRYLLVDKEGYFDAYSRNERFYREFGEEGCYSIKKITSAGNGVSGGEPLIFKREIEFFEEVIETPLQAVIAQAGPVKPRLEDWSEEGEDLPKDTSAIKPFTKADLIPGKHVVRTYEKEGSNLYYVFSTGEGDNLIKVWGRFMRLERYLDDLTHPADSEFDILGVYTLRQGTAKVEKNLIPVWKRETQEDIDRRAAIENLTSDIADAEKNLASLKQQLNHLSDKGNV